jgi:hypothetical protein
MGLSITASDLFLIDAMTHFGAAVDASLFVLRFGPDSGEAIANVYAQLSRVISPVARIGIAGDSIIADIDSFNRTKHLAGPGTLMWRSGVKHDCSKVMELQEHGDELRNGLGELVHIEPDYLYPMLKTSDVANGKVHHPKRWMIVPQRRIGDSTDQIEADAPRTWRYLNSHKALLAKRGSSIYRGKPQFSIFGIGDYSFSSWKVSISGMYKKLQFVKVGTHHDKPIMLDDVTNFLPCSSENAADLLIAMLDSTQARDFFLSYIFWDAKRPITVDLLQRLDLHALADDLGMLPQFEQHFGKPTRSPRGRKRIQSPTLWEVPAP